jgi:hypothetical protein
MVGDLYLGKFKLSVFPPALSTPFRRFIHAYLLILIAKYDVQLVGHSVVTVGLGGYLIGKVGDSN